VMLPVDLDGGSTVIEPAAGIGRSTFPTEETARRVLGDGMATGREPGWQGCPRETGSHRSWRSPTEWRSLVVRMGCTAQGRGVGTGRPVVRDDH
jgi:hypothetical protein